MDKKELEQGEQQNCIDLDEAAAQINVSPTSLRRKVKNGEISHYRPSENGKIYFTAEHLREFKNRRTFEAKTI